MGRLRREGQGVFRRLYLKEEKAEQTLAQRAQVPGETCTTYIEDVLKLCGLANSDMTDEDKVGHLLKGIAEDVYSFLITKETLPTPADVIRHCRAFEALKIRRVTPKFGRLANVTTVASVDVGHPADIASIVRRIIREEFAQQPLVSGNGAAYSPSMRTDAVYHQCALQEPPYEPPVPWAQQSYADQRSSYCEERPNDGMTRPKLRDFTRNYGYAPRRTTGDYQPQRVASNPDGRRDRPTCYNCGVRGHIARFCQRRQRQSSRLLARSVIGPRNPYEASYQAAPHFDYSEAPYQQTSFFDASSQSRTVRDPSPMSDRSITSPSRRGRSPPPRRRSPSPSLGN